MADKPEALIQRLEKLGQDGVGNYGMPICAEAAAELRRQIDQEPEAYKITGKLGDICHFKSSSVRKGDVVYTLSPRVEKEQEPMPRWKIDELMRDAGWQNSAIRQADLDKVEKVVRAVEQALKEKNHA